MNLFAYDSNEILKCLIYRISKLKRNIRIIINYRGIQKGWEFNDDLLKGGFIFSFPGEGGGGSATIIMIYLSNWLRYWGLPQYM